MPSMLTGSRAWSLLLASLACAGGACTLSVEGTAPTGASSMIGGTVTGGGSGGATTTSGAGGASSVGGGHAGGATTTTSAPGGAGGAGGAPCPPASKWCDGACVAINPETGCDPTTCEPCPVTGHATTTCDFGSCAIAACDAGWDDCDGDPANGCESSLTNRHSCAACGVICASGADCVEGKCVCTGEGWLLCGDACAHLPDDHDNCGACGVKCGADQACVDSACVCVDKSLENCGGTCVDLNSDEQNCGACGTVVDCQCGTDCCCHGKKVDLCGDANCGTCGNKCPADKECKQGKCEKKGP